MKFLEARYNDFSTKKIFSTKKTKLSSLRLNAIEHCVLDNIKKVIDKLSKGDLDLNHLPPLFENYNEEVFDNFFLELGFKRSKELLKLFLKIKTKINNCSFETEVFLFYLCIENPCLVNLLFFDKDAHICSDDEDHNCFDDPVPTIDQQFEKIKKSLILFLENSGIKLK